MGGECFTSQAAPIIAADLTVNTLIKRHLINNFSTQLQVPGFQGSRVPVPVSRADEKRRTTPRLGD